jgi:hypothetical protein
MQRGFMVMKSQSTITKKTYLQQKKKAVVFAINRLVTKVH